MRTSTDQESGHTDWLAAAVDEANIPTLLATLVQLTGEWSWTSDRYRISRPRGVSDNDTGGLHGDVQREIRDAALLAYRRLLAGEGVPQTTVTPDNLVDLLEFTIGEPIPRQYGPMLHDDMVAAGVAQTGGTDSVQTTNIDPVGAVPQGMSNPPPGFKVGIIGAGISGLTTAMALEVAGIDYLILEKHDSPGGSWLENHYPGAGVDTPTHLYSWPGLPNDWSRFFSLRDEILGYITNVAENQVGMDRILYGQNVRKAEFSESSYSWTLTAESADGTHESFQFDAVISAVGLFNTPSVPTIPGRSNFAGASFHTAHWPNDLDPTGKRVGVIGSGASAMQVAPAISDCVESLSLFQRTPQWVSPFEKFHVPVPDGVRRLMQEIPAYRWWYRVRLMWMFNDRLWDALEADPEWPHKDRSINATNDNMRKFFTHYIRDQLKGRDDLVQQSIPTYPPFTKRILFDNGWYRTLLKGNVELVTDGISRFTEGGLETADGREIPLDVVVFATGFNAINFLSTFELVGRDGTDIRDVWGDDNAKAYLGTVIPGFPNLFCMYGPNLQAGHGGSFMTTAGAQVRYIMTLFDQMFRRGIRAIDCKPEVCEDYNRRVDEANSTRIWTHPGTSNYYRNSKGRVVVNRAFKNLDFWEWTRSGDLDDFDIMGEDADRAVPKPAARAGANHA